MISSMDCHDADDEIVDRSFSALFACPHDDDDDDVVRPDLLAIRHSRIEVHIVKILLC